MPWLKSPVGGEIRIVTRAPGHVTIEVGIAGNRPLPARFGHAVERDAGMGAVGNRVARQGLKQCRVEADQRAACAMFELGIERCRHVAEDLPVACTV